MASVSFSILLHTSVWTLRKFQLESCLVRYEAIIEEDTLFCPCKKHDRIQFRNFATSTFWKSEFSRWRSQECFLPFSEWRAKAMSPWKASVYTLRLISWSLKNLHVRELDIPSHNSCLEVSLHDNSPVSSYVPHNCSGGWAPFFSLRMVSSRIVQTYLQS